MVFALGSDGGLGRGDLHEECFIVVPQCAEELPSVELDSWVLEVVALNYSLATCEEGRGKKEKCRDTCCRR